MFDFVSPRLRLVTLIIVGIYVLAGIGAQLLSEHEHWQKYFPMVLLAACAVLMAATASFINGVLSNESILCKALWASLGALLAAQGVYEWLSMRQVVGDEDALVLVLCVAASFVVYLLIQLEFLKDQTKNILLLGMAGQTLAAITDASDGGLYVLHGFTFSSFSWVADLFDLIWTPVYAVVLVYIATELSVARVRTRAGSPVKERVVWILTNGRLGDLQQMRALAAQLGWATKIKKVRLKSRLRLNIQAIAPMLFAQSSSDDLRESPPDLVLTAEAPLTPVARWIKRRSGNRTRLVHIGRPAGNTAEIDLVITSQQFPVPVAANVLTLPLPLTEREKFELTLPDREIAREFDKFPRPITAVLIGGQSPPYRFSLADAEEFADRCCKFLGQAGGSLIITTSPRTGTAIELGLSALADAARFAYKWSDDQGQENPYKAILYTADQFIVTADSVSMIADAVTTKRPVFVHELPQKPRLFDLFVNWLYQFRLESSNLRYANPVFWLFWLGTIYLRSDRSEFIRRLREAGLVSEWPIASDPVLADSGELCRQTVEKLFAERNSAELIVDNTLNQA